jgi:2-polyprenyl-3-methyl-5-hydroxy-6-metoxy-1,4-benzoquinol methylase
MKRLHEGNVNTPEFFNNKFNGELAYCDIERQELLSKYYTGGIYVDVGCMDSPMPSILAEKHQNIYALDFADRIVGILSKRYPKVKYTHIESGYNLPFETESVDYVVAGEFIEHLEDPHRFIKEAKRILKKGGYLAISTPFEEGKSQGFIGGKQHLWSFDRTDIDELLDNPETMLLKEQGGTSIIAWKRK